MITKTAKASSYLEENEAHIAEFQQAIEDLCSALKRRAKTHDASKLKEPELTQYTEAEHELEKFKPGSKSYLTFAQKHSIILDRHYSKNPHHVEHFENGFDDMTILDLIDVLVDWKLDCGDGDWGSSSYFTF
jgi:hypothetical protein